MTAEQLADYQHRHPHLFEARTLPVVELEPSTRKTLAKKAPVGHFAPLESVIQAGIVTTLRARGFIVWELYKGTARGGQVFVTKGLPDLLVLRVRHGLVFLEVKRPVTGRLSEAQRARHDELRAACVPSFVVTSIAGALAALEEIWG